MRTNALSLPLAKTAGISLHIGLLCAYGCVVFWVLHGYFIWDVNVCLALATAPYIFTVNRAKLSVQYVVPTILLGILAVLLPVRSVLLAATFFAALLLIENSIGKVNYLVLFLLMLVSPIFKYSIMLAQVPVRFWLSAKVAALFGNIGMAASASGNQIIVGQTEFSVDPACAGLNMLATSLIICLFVIGFYQRRTKTQLHFLSLTGMLLLTIGLNVVCNFFRIVFLVLFKIMPETFFHDFVGMLCLVLYVVLPLLQGCKFIFKPNIAQSKKPLGQQPAASRPPLRYPFLHIGLLSAMVLMAFRLSAMQSRKNVGNADINLQGYKRTKLDDGVLKFENKEALIYLKPTEFYSAGHDPLICWTGSGYEFKRVDKSVINGITVNSAILQKGNDKIYAAWWFDDGQLQTADQLKWRWTAAHGQRRFYLVNVNATTPQLLQNKAEALLKHDEYLNTSE